MTERHEEKQIKNGTHSGIACIYPNLAEYLSNQLLHNVNNECIEDSLKFWVGRTILHEYVHLGDWADGVLGPGESGDLFEDDAYGQDVTRNNAVEILLKGSKDYQ